MAEDATPWKFGKDVSRSESDAILINKVECISPMNLRFR